MSLFNGVENFTPAFTGQQLAIQAGSGAAQAFSSGMNAGSNRQQVGQGQQRLDFQKKQYENQIKALDSHGSWLASVLNGADDDYLSMDEFYQE